MTLPLRRSSLKAVFGVRAKTKDHSRALEAQGVLLGLRRLAWSPSLQSDRGCMLLDTKAVWGALQKGRSSAPTLRRVVSQIGAQCLACDWRLRYEYLPSENNRADTPSRGTQQEFRRRNVNTHPRLTRTGTSLKRKYHSCCRLLHRVPSDSSLRVCNSSASSS